MLAAESEPMRGLILFSYPLHPAGKPDRLRIDHLPSIEVPMFFVQGSRDRLSTHDLFDRHVRTLDRTEVLDLEGADHSWRIEGRNLASVNREVAESTANWIRHLATGG
jgi:predicted alpha/beta-hydrolase family hydrolase